LTFEWVVLFGEIYFDIVHKLEHLSERVREEEIGSDSCMEDSSGCICLQTTFISLELLRLRVYCHIKKLRSLNHSSHQPPNIRRRMPRLQHQPLTSLLPVKSILSVNMQLFLLTRNRLSRFNIHAQKNEQFTRQQWLAMCAGLMMGLV